MRAVNAFMAGNRPRTLTTTATLSTPARTLFSNQKASYGPPINEADAKARDEDVAFFTKRVESEADILPGRKVEEKLPSKKQLNDELPTGEELEKAIREGRMDQYVSSDKEKGDW